MPPETDNRAQNRSNVFLAAVLVVGSARLPVRVRNLSPRGALLDGASLPASGVGIQLTRGALSAEGRVAWRGGDQAGVSFAGEIDVDAWVKRVGHAGQRRVDEAIAALRRDGAKVAITNEPASPSLTRVSEELDQICERLAASTALTVELGRNW